MTTKILTHVSGGDFPLLTIGVLTIPERKKEFETLKAKIVKAIGAFKNVEFISCHSPKGKPTIGEKRNMIVNNAAGHWVVMVDDDDTIHPDYFNEVIPILERDDPDCIGHLVRCTFIKDGKFTHNAKAKISLEYNGLGEAKTDPDYDYLQGIYYKVPIRRALMLKEPFKNISFAEDQDFSLRIKKHLRKQSFVNKYLYHYIYNTYTGETRKKRYAL